MKDRLNTKCSLHESGSDDCHDNRRSLIHSMNEELLRTQYAILSYTFLNGKSFRQITAIMLPA